MAKSTARTRSVKAPKVKNSASIQKIDRAVRIVAEKRSSSGKHATRETEEARLLRDVDEAEKELAAGKGVAHTKARSQVLSRLRR